MTGRDGTIDIFFLDGTRRDGDILFTTGWDGAVRILFLNGTGRYIYIYIFSTGRDGTYIFPSRPAATVNLAPSITAYSLEPYGSARMLFDFVFWYYIC